MSNSLNGRKVAVIGCGFVGSTTAYSLMQSKLFTDMVLIDVDTNRAEGEALDISHGIPYYSPMNIYAGTYEDLSDASIVIITAGANQKPGETRLDLVQKNVIDEAMGEKGKKYAPYLISMFWLLFAFNRCNYCSKII